MLRFTINPSSASGNDKERMLVTIPAMWCEENDPAIKHPARGLPSLRKKNGQCEAQIESKIWTVLLGSRKEKKQFGGPKNRV